MIEHTKEQLNVVMSAVPKQLVDACLQAAEAVGLVPVVVEPNINAIARVLDSADAGNLLTLVVDIGPASTDIAVLDKSAVRLTGGVAIGGNTFTIDISSISTSHSRMPTSSRCLMASRLGHAKLASPRRSNQASNALAPRFVR